jgi:ABC-type transport system substrate-binding protein
MEAVTIRFTRRTLVRLPSPFWKGSGVASSVLQTGALPQPSSSVGRRSLGRRLAAAALVACSLVAAPALAQPAAPKKVIQIPIRTDGPKSLDPAKGSTQYDNQGCAQIYDTLLQFKYLARPLDLEPNLTTTMPEVVNNADGTQTWTFTLREDVFFHDADCFPGGKGRKLVTDDVFYSWKRLADPAFELENWWIIKDLIVGLDEYKEEQGAAVKAGKKFDYEKPVAGLKKISDTKFQVVLKQAIQQFRWKIAQFQMSVVPREAVEKYGEQFSRRPVGSGPFILAKEDDWKPGEKLILTKNPNYRTELFPKEFAPGDEAFGFDKAAGQKLPLVDRIEVTFYVPDPPMWLDFEQGKLGFVQVPAEYFDKAFVRRTKQLRDEYKARGITSHAVPLLDFIFRGFNMDDELLGGYTEEKKKLRQAISLAIDLDEMNESFYNGLNAVYDGPIPVGLDGHPKNGEAENSYRGPDIQRAKKLLAEAGYPDGKGLPDIVYYTSRGANNAEQVQAESRMLKEIGVNLNPRLVDFSELIEAVNKKKAPLFGFAWGSDYPDAENNLALFYGPNKAPGANHYNYNRKDYDAMYEKSRTMPPGPERTKLYEEMRDMIIEDVPYIGSMGRIRFYIVNPWLKNFKPVEDFNNWFKYLDVDDSKRK